MATLFWKQAKGIVPGVLEANRVFYRQRSRDGTPRRIHALARPPALRALALPGEPGRGQSMGSSFGGREYLESGFLTNPVTRAPST